jgi:NitT/TauT family transport system substrate-binding protein
MLALVLCAGLAAAAAAEEAPLGYRLKWLFNASVAGDLVADAEGFFQRAGLRVAVKAGGPEKDAIKELELGQAHFGVASADQVIRALAKGAPVAVIAQLFQINPLQWIYRPDQVAITSAADLKGKVIGVTFGGNDEAIMRALLASAGLAETDAQLYSVRYDYTPFYQRRVQLWPVYRNAQGILIGDKLAQAGEPVAYFDPHGAGIRFVANSVITSRKMLREAPDRVQRFRSALLAAWRQALDPAQSARTVAVIARHDSDTAPDTIARQLAATRELMIPPPGRELGWIDTQAWLQTESIMLEQRLIERPVGIEAALAAP